MWQALELAAEATIQADYKDWFWKVARPLLGMPAARACAPVLRARARAGRRLASRRKRTQARLGKAYYQLGLYRDAEKQFKSALKSQEMVSTHLELTKVR